MDDFSDKPVFGAQPQQTRTPPSQPVVQDGVIAAPAPSTHGPSIGAVEPLPEPPQETPSIEQVIEDTPAPIEPPQPEPAPEASVSAEAAPPVSEQKPPAEVPATEVKEEPIAISAPTSTNNLAYDTLLDKAIELGASDLYITYDSPPAFRIEGTIHTNGVQKFDDDSIQEFLDGILNEDQIDDFESTFELNVSTNWKDKARFRINVFRQQLHSAIVIRRIQTDIPQIAELGLPPVYKDLVLQQRGLILLVGATGSGKSTSLAAMIDHRNTEKAGHIITIEDPIEYIHSHKRSIISQRDVGVDTYSFGMALKNTLRQQPYVILIGEIRDQETMEHAVNFAETGHLCLATLHANNSNQAIERILSFFPEVKHRQVMLNLALNLKAILSQRLIPTHTGGRAVAVEVLMNQGVMRELIREGDIKEMKEMMDKNSDIGMQTFDKAIFDMLEAGMITEANAIAFADNEARVRLMIMKRKQMEHHAKHGGTGLPKNLDVNSATETPPESDF